LAERSSECEIRAEQCWNFRFIVTIPNIGVKALDDNPDVVSAHHDLLLFDQTGSTRQAS